MDVIGLTISLRKYSPSLGANGRLTLRCIDNDTERQLHETIAILEGLGCTCIQALRQPLNSVVVECLYEVSGVLPSNALHASNDWSTSALRRWLQQEVPQ